MALYFPPQYVIRAPSSVHMRAHIEKPQFERSHPLHRLMLCHAYGMQVAMTHMDATEPHVTSATLLTLALSMGEYAMKFKKKRRS